MDTKELFEEILIVQKKQTELLMKLLSAQKDKNSEYYDLLVEQKKANDEYCSSLEKSAEETSQREMHRTKEHEAYLRGARVNWLSHYTRMITSLALVGLVAYIAFVK